MKTTLAVALAFAVLGLTGLVWADEWPETPARLSLVEGAVVTQIGGSADWMTAVANFPLAPGDRVRVNGYGRAEVQLPEGNAVRLGDDTILDLLPFPQAGPGATPLRLERGMATFYISRFGPEPADFRVDLPTASVLVSIPSTFRTDLFPDGSIQVSVHSGEIVVDAPGGMTEVRSRQTLTLSPDRTPQLYALAPWDEFDRWNDLRDIQITRASRAPYIPTEFASYAPDFVAYGRWVPVPDYGYAWAPTVEAGWSPFRHGRWIWWRGESVWLSHEAWGWVPYHYGRWRFYPVTGWVWIPPVAAAVIWHPGAVGWVLGSEFVAWVPLAPGEIYYGRRHYGPGSVNITNIQVTNIHVTNVFVNTKVTNGVVVVHKEAYMGGGRGPASFVPPKDVFGAGGRASLGPPPLRPVTATSPPGPTGPITMPVRKSPEFSRSTVSKPQGREVSGIGARPAVPGFRGPAVKPEARPHRVAPEVFLGSPPPRATSTPSPRKATSAGEVRSTRGQRALVPHATPPPQKDSRPAYGRTKAAPPSTPSRQSSASPGQAGGR